MPSWLRWILVLPIAIASCLVVQVIVAILFSLADLLDESNWPHSMNDLVTRMATYFAGSYCFVFAGVFVAPSHKRHSAIVLTVVGIVLLTWFAVTALIKGSRWELSVSAIIGISACVVACLRVMNDAEPPSGVHSIR